MPKRYPIREVAERTGLTTQLIRAWEQRYDAVTPGRTDTNRRLYSDADIQRLNLIREMTRRGQSVGQIASLSMEALGEMLIKELDRDRRRIRESSQNEPPTPSPGVATPYSQSPSTHNLRELRPFLDAIQMLDAGRLEAELDKTLIELGQQSLLDDLIAPLMHDIGQRWHDGNLRVIHEHLATSVIRNFLLNHLNSQRASENSPRVVMTTPSGQIHEIGALMAAIHATSAGWKVTYLGADLPANEIAAAAQVQNARAVGLSIVYPPDDAALPAQLEQLAGMLSPGTRLFVGGASADAYLPTLRRIGATHVRQTRDLFNILHEIRR